MRTLLSRRGGGSPQQSQQTGGENMEVRVRPVDSRFRQPPARQHGRSLRRRSTRTSLFLAGAFGRTVERACTMPEGKAMFIPVLNLVDINTTSQTADELRAKIDAC